MNKKLAAIISGALVIALLAGTLVFLVLNPMSAGEGTSGDNTEKIQLINESSANLERLKVTNPDDEYTIEKLGDDSYGVKAVEGFKQRSNTVTTTLHAISGLAANSVVAEECDDLGQYGLAEPTTFFEAKYTDGKTYSFSVGNIAPDGITQYVVETGKNTVYAVSSSELSYLGYDRFQYLDLTVVPAVLDEEGEEIQAILNYVEINRPDLDKPIIFDDSAVTAITQQSITSSMHMLSPIDGMMSLTAIQNTILPIFNMSARSIVAVNPTEEDLGKYGLLEPSSSIQVDYNDDATLKIYTGYGIDQNGQITDDPSKAVSYYAMRETMDIIFVLNTAQVPWRTITADDYISSVLALPYIGDVSSVTVDFGDTQYDLGITHIEVPAEDPAEEPTEEQSFTLNGQDAVEESARDFYVLLLTTAVQGLNKNAPTVEPSLTITYHLINGKSMRIDVYVEPDLTTILSLDGNNAYVGRSGYVEKVRREVENLAQGKDVDGNW